MKTMAFQYLLESHSADNSQELSLIF
jgi:hypothetical protein